MKAYERRAAGKEDYCNLDFWNPRIGCWQKTSRQYESEAEARKAAKKPGRYRISRVENGERIESSPFEIKGGVPS